MGPSALDAHVGRGVDWGATSKAAVVMSGTEIAAQSEGPFPRDINSRP